MLHKRIFICLLLLSVVLSACDNKTAERSNENTMDIKRIIIMQHLYLKGKVPCLLGT